MDRDGWALAFLGTLVLETPVYFLALRRALGPGGALLASLVLNLATHPLAWSAITGASHAFPWIFLAVEGAVTVVEALLIFAIGRTGLSRQPIGSGEALAMSLAANGFSAGVGLYFWQG
jgi:hypothetical protein